jgi:hypothetical protein
LILDSSRNGNWTSPFKKLIRVRFNTDNKDYVYLLNCIAGRTYDQEPVYAVGDNQQEFLPQMGNWVAMEIATILSPCHFYAILPLGNKSLDTTSSESEKKESKWCFYMDCIL